MSEIDIGHEIPRLETVITGDQVRRFATAANMAGRRFFSDEVARKDGLRGQIFPGNMSMALLARMVHDWLPRAHMVKLGVTFRGFVYPGDVVCKGFVTDRREVDGAVELECDLILEQDGERRTTGLAVLRLDPASLPR